MSDARGRNRMLAVITALLVIEGLRISYPVTMPLATAAVIVAAVWPIKPWLDRVFPSSLSYIGTVLVLLIISVAFIGAVYFSAVQVVATFFRHRERFEQLFTSVSDLAERWGFGGFGGQEGLAALAGFIQGLLANGYTTIAYLGFIAILVIFSLPEVPAMRRMLRRELDGRNQREVVQTVEKAAEKIRSYLGLMLVTSILTGAGVAGIAFAVGLDLALMWGLLNFLLNFIPVIGNIIGIIPPAIYAFVQFQDWTMPIVVLTSLSVLQVVISYFVFPMLQGRSLSLSPLVVLVAVAFWGWLWGVAGALIAVPLTSVIIIVCEHFTSTAWIAKLLNSEHA